MNWLFWRTTKVNPNITITEIDKTVHIPDPKNLGIIMSSEKGPLKPPILIGANVTIEPIRWWQFWKYHLIKKRKQQLKEATEEFIKIFGQPRKLNETEENYLAHKAMFGPEEKLWCVRTVNNKNEN